ncbi:protein translocase subunit SecDF [Reichenbachiella versicolor]|uniref:protein translocase subunit SecDF n=1 Tax=Reichenbachiella versicolor TaxID=1821036 RepID=UPI000D6E5EF1|nr:protein translocase subunit SecDF [Reichenbachiella versicolor]
MKNKGGVVFLTVIISLLCIYYLSFTFVEMRINEQATEAATVGNTTDYTKKQQYLDSIWQEPVYNLFGIDFTYQDIKETELNLGLDLKGGMHVTLEVSPVEIVKGISGNSSDTDFLKALDMAKANVKGTQLNYVSEFYKAFQEVAPGKSLASVFATAANKGRISLSTSDKEVLDMINEEVDDAIDRSFNILRTRIDRFGTSQPNIQKLQGTGRIQIELPGVDNPERVRKLLQGVAKLEFWEVHEMQEIFPTLQAMNDNSVKNAQAAEAEIAQLSADEDAEPVIETESEDLGDLLSTDESDSSAEGDDLAAQLESDSSTAAIDSANLATQVSPLFSLLKAQYGLIYDLKDTAQVNRVIDAAQAARVIPSTMKFMWDVKPMKNQDDFSTDKFIQLHAIKMNRGGKAPLSGEVIVNAYQDLDQRSAPSISMSMNATGAKKWRKLTAANINRRIAVVLDGYVYSAPNVQGEIPNGQSQITGDFSLEEAQDLANILKAGSLPAPTTIVEDVVIGPTLGKVAQNQGFLSIVCGLGIVIVFMILYYSKGGAIANVALFFNVFFILGILAQLNAALTLPGIAGIVLTIGMSIDANVLIFERIKEELRNGAGIKQAISSGYNKAFSSIVDANVTTFLVGIILYTLGQGPLKGFAITLMIGIACSFFSAVFITRVIVEWASKKGDDSKISFATGIAKNFLTNLSADFISKRKFAYLFSLIFIGIGIVAMIGKGLTYGVDFTGGRSYVVAFEEPVISSDLKVALSKTLEGKGVEVKTYGANNILKVTTSYMIDDESDAADAQVKEIVVKGISEFTGLSYIEDDTKRGADEFTIASSSKVGATIADDIKNASFESVVFALIVIFLYILVRFRKWQFGLGAIIALFHDTMFVLSAFAIANVLGISFEVDQVFIAAMLTIIGYSINDTVVVFDRVRENMGLKEGSELKPVFNEALNSTISRTMITSITTLIVVIVLFVAGGAVLKGFSFALIVGILIGTYSSIFIATPVVIDFNSKKA